MGMIKVKDYLLNILEWDDLRRTDDNQVPLKEYIERVHLDKFACHVPGYKGFKAPKRNYKNYILTAPHKPNIERTKFLARERTVSNNALTKFNVDNCINVNNEVLFGEIYNDVGVNSVEATVGFNEVGTKEILDENGQTHTEPSKLYYSITQHLKSLKGINNDILAYYTPHFFLHLSDMLENKEYYLQNMTAEAFDDLLNGVITAIITGENSMDSCNTRLLRYIGFPKFTDICRVGIDERVYNELVANNASYQDIKDYFENQGDMYSQSASSAYGRAFLTPRQQIEGLTCLKNEGLLSPSNLQTIEDLANYNVDMAIARAKDHGAILSPSHIDAVKYFMAQSEDIVKA